MEDPIFSYLIFLFFRVQNFQAIYLVCNPFPHKNVGCFICNLFSNRKDASSK